MCNSKILKASAAAILALGLGMSPALSDDNAEGGWSGGWGMGQMMGRGGGRGSGDCMMGMGTGDRIDGRLAFMKAELKITDDQQDTWKALVDTVRNNAEVHTAMMQGRMKDMRSGDFLKKPLPERLAMHEALMESRLEQIKEVRGAVEKLYAVLKDDQKKSADEIMLPMMGMGCGMGMGRGRMMMRDD